MLENGLSERGSAGVSVGKIPGTGGLQHVATEVQGARREWQSWRRRGVTEVHATTCSACASPCVGGGGTSLPEIGGGWPDSVCSLAGPSESVLCTIHIPQLFRSYHACFHRDPRQPRRHRHHRLRRRCRLPDQVIDHRGWSPVAMSDPGPLCGAGFFMSGERSGECILRGRSVTIS